MDVGMSVYGKIDLIKRRGPATFSITTYRTTYMFSPSFKPAKNRIVPSHVHTNPHFFSFNESALRPHESSESTHQNRIVLKLLSEVVTKTRSQVLSGLKNTRFKKFPDLCGRGLKS